MDNNDLLTRQRKALLAFRQAGKERQAAERQANHDLDDVEKKANHQQEVAQTQLEVGRNWLRKVNLAHLVQKDSSPFVPADTGRTPCEELAQWVERAQQAAAGVEASVRAKQTFQEAVDAASRAERHAKDAKRGEAEAKTSSEQANLAWKSIKGTHRWKAAKYFRAKLETAMDEAARAYRQAGPAAREAAEAAERAQSSLSFLDSVTAVAEAAGRAEAQARTAALRAVGEAKAARQAADEAEQAARKAIDAAQAAKRTWRRRVSAAIVIAGLAMAVTYFFVTEPEAHYQAAATALEAGDWEQAQLELEPLKGRLPFWRDVQALRRESHHQAAVDALEAERWETSRDEIQLMAQDGAPYQDVQDLLRKSYYREAIAAAKAEEWEAGAKAIFELYKLDQAYTGVADLLADYPRLSAALEASTGPLWPPNGRWDGTITERGSEYSVVLVLTNCDRQQACGSTHYPELSCRGKLTFDGVRSGKFVFTEQITEGKDRCVNTVVISMTPGTAGKWYYSTKTSQGTLTKSH